MGGKCDCQHSMAHPRKPPYRRKNLTDIPYTDRVIANFVPNFVAMVTGVGGQKCNWQHSMAHSPKPNYRCKNLADISYTDRVIALFVPNFVGMATGVSQGNAIGSIQWPIPENPPLDAKISQISITQAEL